MGDNYFNKAIESVKVNFKWVSDIIRIFGIKVIQKWVSSRDTVTGVHVCRESVSDVNGE